jgi:hypothetical protein
MAHGIVGGHPENRQKEDQEVKKNLDTQFHRRNCQLLNASNDTSICAILVELRISRVPRCCCSPVSVVNCRQSLSAGYTAANQRELPDDGRLLGIEKRRECRPAIAYFYC